MRSGGNDFNYFELTKLANFWQFKRMLMLCLEDWGPGPPGHPWPCHWQHSPWTPVVSGGGGFKNGWILGVDQQGKFLAMSLLLNLARTDLSCVS